MKNRMLYKLMAVIQEYFGLTEKYINKFGEKTVLRYQVGSFYEMYANKENDGSFSGCNIQEFAKIGNLAMGKKTAVTVMLGFSTYMFEKYVPNFLIDKNIEVNDLKTLLNGLKLVGDYLDKTILKPNNLNYPNSRLLFIDSLK